MQKQVFWMLFGAFVASTLAIAYQVSPSKSAQDIAAGKVKVVVNKDCLAKYEGMLPIVKASGKQYLLDDLKSKINDCYSPLR